MSREWYREQLRAMSDDELLERTVTLKRLEREDKERGRLCPLLMQCWYETLDRGREDLYLAALERVREEERRWEARSRRIDDGTHSQGERQ